MCEQRLNSNNVITSISHISLTSLTNKELEEKSFRVLSFGKDWGEATSISTK